MELGIGIKNRFSDSGDRHLNPVIPSDFGGGMLYALCGFIVEFSWFVIIR